MKTIKFFILAAAVLTLWVGCNKDNSTGTTRVKVRMTDAPANYEQVNVDVKAMVFKIDNDTAVNLNVTAGVYNLLDFANGLDTLIASNDVQSGKLSQVRLILGTNNSVKVDGVVYPLTTPSAQQSGLKLSMNSVLTPGVDYNLLLDFDANLSVVKTGNGTYQLKPVIRVITAATTGSIHGSIVTSLALPATVSATNGTTTYTTVTDDNGNFLVHGLPAGTYTVIVTPKLPFLPVTVSNVAVTVGIKAELTALAF
ncbi:MAG TPA: carbohydrate-binding protein [Prolixibacteraceae bacterium]|jgi:hypothetical protein|nr:carbohydrate-binding protein [Prolixibacteraceae bacterium]